MYIDELCKLIHNDNTVFFQNESDIPIDNYDYEEIDNISGDFLIIFFHTGERKKKKEFIKNCDFNIKFIVFLSLTDSCIRDDFFITKTKLSENFKEILNFFIDLSKKYPENKNNLTLKDIRESDKLKWRGLGGVFNE